MKVKKVVGISVIVLAAVCLTMVVVVILSLNTLITTGIKTFGSEATGTKVDIQKVNISFLSGSVELSGMQIANPSGYKEANAFGFGRFYVNLKLKSLLTDKIIVDNIIIEDIAVDMEPSMSKGSNLQEIKNNIMKYCKIDPNAPKTEPKDAPAKQPAPPADDKKGKKVVINNFEIRSGTIIFAAKDIGLSAKIPMPKVSIQGIGADSDDGKPAGDVLLEIYNKTLESITKAANAGQLNALTNESTQAVKDLGAGAKEGVDKLKKAFGF
jgi:uncharacterized protein involved in outer membrane biogenesis